jgi:biotin synthase
MSHKKWTHEEIAHLYEMPFMELMFEAQSTHRQHFHPNEMELCSILNIKTGACPENCAYCSQSGHFKTGLQREKLLNLEEVIQQATEAKKNGAVRFCMGAAWRSPSKKDLPHVIDMIKAVKAIGLETCVTLGMLDAEQAKELHAPGLDFYNHNLDTSPAYYQKIVSTRTYQDRLDTLEHVRASGIHVCCGGIIGMGESRTDRIELLAQLANLPEPPKSVPINHLIPIQGTPLEKVAALDHFEFIRTIAVARIMMPSSVIRLSAGRQHMSEEMQALCFMAGANSMWLSPKLLTTENRDVQEDDRLLERLGMRSTHESSACNL